MHFANSLRIVERQLHYKMRMQHFGLNTAGRVRCGLPTKQGLWQETIGVQNCLVFKVGSRTD